MLSRVAEAIYWTNRYVERAENVARFIDVNLHLMFDSPVGQKPSWDPLIQTTGDQESFVERYGEATPQAVMQFLTFDQEYSSSIASCVAQARENARTIRHITSRDMWEQLNRFYLMVSDVTLDDHPSPTEMAGFYADVKLASITYEGLTNATLTRGEAWHFSRLGRMIERADKTSRILDVKYFILLPAVREVGTTVDQVGWAALLASASALQMYRQNHHVTNPRRVAEFLVLDRHFPRSIRYCLAGAQESLHAITGTPLGTYRNEPEQLLGKLRANLDYVDIEAIFKTGLHEYLDGLQAELNEVGAAIHRQFFELHD